VGEEKDLENKKKTESSHEEVHTNDAARKGKKSAVGKNNENRQKTAQCRKRSARTGRSGGEE